MPREQINHPTQQTDAPWGDSAVHVGWYNDPDVQSGEGTAGWVQIGLEVDISYAQFAAASPNGCAPNRTLMWTPVLTAAEIDKAIAVLKRARRAQRKN